MEIFFLLFQLHEQIWRGSIIDAVCLCFCVSVCRQDYFQSNQLISLKLGGLPVGRISDLLVVTQSRIQISDHFSSLLSIPE